MTLGVDLRAADRPLLGVLISTPSEEHAEAIAATGIDWVFIDAEHGPLTVGDIQRLVRAVGPKLMTLVRVPECSDTWIERVMGTGCTGIIAPQVNTAAMATEVVAAALYPPRGRRGVGPVRAQGYGTGTATELASANDQTLVVVQAEHVDAVENIDAIVRVEGVSAVFIGPYDLSASLGRPGELTHPEVEAAMTTIRTACSAAGMPVGIFAGSTERARAVAEGTTLLACGTDLQWATGAIRAMVSSLNLE